MSDSQAQARQQAIDYLVRLLQMNPLQQGEDVIRERTKALRLEQKTAAPKAASTETLRADRRQLLEQLEAIRNQFWTTPIDELMKSVADLNSEGFGDLEAAISRLRVVANHRAKFPALAGKPGFDGEFFSSFKEVLIRSPRDTAVLREKVLSTFGNRKRRSSGKKMVALLKTEMPAIYSLEADWLDTLYRQKGQLPVIRLKSPQLTRARAVGSGGAWRNFLWAPWIIIALIRALVALSDGSSPKKQAPANPNYSSRAPQVYSPGNFSPRDYLAPRNGNGVNQGPNTPTAPTFADPNQRSREPFAMPKAAGPPGNSNSNRFQNNAPRVPQFNPSPSPVQSNGRFR